MARPDFRFCVRPSSRLALRALRAAVGGLAIFSLVLPAGCSSEFYKQQADADVYKILKDRKYDTVGYNAQTSVGSAAIRSDAPGSVSRAGAKEEAESQGAKKVVPGPGTTAVPAKAYDPIPVTPLPPVVLPPIEPPAVLQPWGPLGPWKEGTPDGTAGLPATPAMAAKTSQAMGSVLEYGPPAPPRRPVSLDLFGALAYGVQHSRTYRDQMDAVYLAALDVTLQRHLFEPRPFTTLGVAYNGAQKDPGYTSALTATANAGIRQKLPYGGEIVASALVSFVNAISGTVSNGESAQVALSGSLPLLRGAGLVNLEPLIASERGVVYQIRSFEDFRRQYAVQVATQYFTVLTALQSVKNRQNNVYNYQDLLNRARVLFAAPVGLKARQSFIEVQRAEQSLLQGQDDLLAAEANYLNTLDDFKVLIGMDVRQDLEILPVELQLNLPDFQSQDAVSLATSYRLDLRTARDKIDDARRQIAVAENGLLPDLNLTAEGQAGNRPGSAAHQLDSRDMTYSAGITLDLPLDRVAERNTYRQSLISYYSTRRAYEDLHDQISADVRSAVRAIRQAQSSVNIQQRSINLAQLRLENASILLRTGGSSSTRDFVEAQDALLTAQDRYEQAKANLQVQVLQYLRQTGTLRVDPSAGTLGRAMDRAGPPPVDSAGDLVPEWPLDRTSDHLPDRAAAPAGANLGPQAAVR